MVAIVKGCRSGRDCVGSHRPAMGSSRWSVEASRRSGRWLLGNGSWGNSGGEGFLGDGGGDVARFRGAMDGGTKRVMRCWLLRIEEIKKGVLFPLGNWIHSAQGYRKPLVFALYFGERDDGCNNLVKCNKAKVSS